MEKYFSLTFIVYSALDIHQSAFIFINQILIGEKSL